MARILVIDDDNAFREMLCEMLKNEGYDVLFAVDGKEGIDIYRKELPDLIITDIIMPEKEGFETIFELSNDFPEVKILVMSGGGKGRAEDYLNVTKLIPNIKGAFAKPFEMDEMLQTIKKTLEA